MSIILDTGVKNVRNVLRYISGEGSVQALPSIINERRRSENQPVVYFIDEFFKDILLKLDGKSAERISDAIVNLLDNNIQQSN